MQCSLHSIKLPFMFIEYGIGIDKEDLELASAGLLTYCSNTVRLWSKKLVRVQNFKRYCAEVNVEKIR